MQTAGAIDPVPILRALVDHGCRFVIVGSVARRFTGAEVEPRGLDIVVAADAEQRHRILAALESLHATVHRRHGIRPVRRHLNPSWEWSWTAMTRWGSVDVISRFVDGTDLAQIEPDAHEVEPELGLVVRCLPTEHAA